MESNYEQLVKALRCCAENFGCPIECPRYSPADEGVRACVSRLETDAAAAIEELDAEETRLLLITSELQDKVVELEEELNDADVAADDNARQIEELQAEVSELKRVNMEIFDDLPKRGKWIIDGAFTYNLRELNGKAYEPVYRCSCCNRQTESYVRLDEPKMPEEADFPEYCPHCGAEMGGTDEQRT